MTEEQNKKVAEEIQKLKSFVLEVEIAERALSLVIQNPLHHPDMQHLKNKFIIAANKAIEQKKEDIKANFIREEFTKMLDDEGCPKCKSPETSEIEACISGYPDNTSFCICESCGNWTPKYTDDIQLIERELNEIVRQ